jgi:predicted ATP-dependent serine protease
LNDMTARDFPRKLFKQLERRKATTSPPPTEPTQPWKIVKAALKTIPNDGGGQSNSRDWWIKMLAALHHESVGSDKGRKLAHSWSNRWPGADPDQTETAWNSFGKGKSKAAGATILFEARTHGWTDPRAAQRILAMFEDLDAKPPKSKSKGLTFLSPSDCAKFEPRPYVLKHVIAEHDIGCIVGQPGVGKSVFAPALAYAVAQGRPFQGQRTKQGRTFYVAAEDEYGMRGRIHALSKEHGPAEDFLLVGGVHDLLNEDLAGHGSADYYALLKAVKKHQPALVVIDTLAMAFPGLEENNAEAMGRVVNVARSLTQWGSAVILVHHDTKDGSGIGRGHSILNGALDMSLHLSRQDNGTLGVQVARSEANTIIGGTLSKNRNGSCGTTFSFTITGTEIGVDQDGDIVTAATLRNVTPSNSTAPRMTRSQNAALVAITEMVDERGEVSETEWRNAAKDDRSISSAEMLESRIKAVSRAMTFLKKIGRITITDGKIYVQDSSQSELEFSDLGDEN